MMRVVSMTLVLALGGCGIVSSAGGLFRGGLRGNQAQVNGVYFRSRISPAGDDRRGFVVTTRGAGRAPLAAAEAGRVEAVSYCLRTFGGSEIAWAAGPDREPAQIAIDPDGTLVLTGTCIAR